MRLLRATTWCGKWPSGSVCHVTHLTRALGWLLLPFALIFGALVVPSIIADILPLGWYAFVVLVVPLLIFLFGRDDRPDRR